MRLSACMITKDDPRIVQAIDSIRPFVDEICILDSSVDPTHATQVRLSADRYAREDNGIEDWSDLRRRSFALATGDAIVWLDSDDIIFGAEHLRDMAAAAVNGKRVVCPYEYATDPETGRVTALQVRERIVANDPKIWTWRYPAHEVLVRIDGERPVDVYDHRAVWKHQRPVTLNAAHNERALRILRKYAEEPGHDRLFVHFNLGVALAAAGEYSDAIAHLRQYLAGSEWSEQRVVALLRMADCEVALRLNAGADAAIAWAEAARDEAPDTFAPLYALARFHFLKGCIDTESMRECVRLCREAIATPIVQRVLAVNPLDREVAVRELLRIALDVVGDHDGALAEVRAALRGRPSDPTLLLAERDYLRAIGVEPTKAAGALDIVFACGASPEPWDPASIAKTGMGGSETAVVAMAKGLAALGHRVRVYGDPANAGLYDGVEYHSIHGAEPPICDVLVAWRNAGFVTWGTARTRVLWVHDVVALNMNFERAMACDRVLALSGWHKDNLVAAHGLHPDHVTVTRNGIDLDRFANDGKNYTARTPRRAIYSSSPDRGLALLLDVWPEIRAEVPDAELVVAYGFEGWERAAGRTGDPHHHYLIESMKRRMREKPGIDYVGRVDQKQLARMMCSVGVWTLPGWFDETSCIGAMEAQAAGCRIVASKRAALIETVGHNGALIEGDWLSQDYRAAYVDAMVEALRDDGIAKRAAAQNTARDRFAWSGVVTEWNAMFRELLDAADAAILPPYSQVAA